MIKPLLLYFLFMSIAAFLAMKRDKESAKIPGERRYGVNYLVKQTLLRSMT